MTLTIDNLNELDESAVTARREQQLALLEAAFPTTLVRNGPIEHVLVELEAMLGAQADANASLLEQSGSLYNISQDPALADTDTVDLILSNWRLERTPAAQATGPVAFIVDRFEGLVVPSGMVLTSGSTEFQTTQAYAVRTSDAAVSSATDRVLQAVGNGQYAFTVPVEAVEPGASGMLRRGDGLVTLTDIPNLTDLYAAADFTGGVDAESTEDLIGKLEVGAAASTWGNRTTIEAMLRAEPEFDGLLALSIIGHRDPEQLRDDHSIFPVHAGGRCDVYARTAGLSESVTVERTATLVGTVADGGVWQLTVGRDDAPGFYGVQQVVRSDAGDVVTAGFTVTSDVRGFDIGDDDPAPDVQTAVEAAFSRYSTAVIQFVDTQTSVVGLTVGTATQDYLVTLDRMPQLVEMQEFLADRARTATDADVVVRGALLCQVGVGGTIFLKSGQTAPDVAAIAAALATFVNTSGFAARLFASELAGIVQDFLEPGMACGTLTLTGRIRGADGSVVTLDSSESLTIPENYPAQISPRTTVFALDPASVSLITALRS